MVAFIQRHGKLQYAEAIGYADLESRTPIRTDNLFRIASMTKPVIAAAVLKLVDAGKLKLDDPVSNYIPAFAETKVYGGGPAANPRLKPAARPITIEHLLTHTSGLTYGAFGETPVDSIYRAAKLLNASRTIQQVVDSIARLPLVFSPGDAWNYSVSIDVLGRLIEVVSGKPLDQYLSEEIFVPLGMRETMFRVVPGTETRVVTLYRRGANGVLQRVPNQISAIMKPDGKLLSGGGGLLSTPADYLRFAQMLLNGGELEGHRILSRSSVANMMRNHLPPSLIPIGSPILGQSGYGFGLAGAVLVDSVAAGLPGSPGIYRWWGINGTFFWIDPKADLIGMVWTQFNTGRVYPVELDFQRLAYAALSK